ncbi:hypothetical protein MPH_01748 [Macrophomina phaseolina MS6]|uniref:Uncharacterized protein n=1 Tax=Macrophomina phaseolina (strain MS6) TaxID=1126212 RepID=K2SEL9_MACPH|nr:hypothetical protein MPH_01748 [Macrophomina phaseolina MS6]
MTNANNHMCNAHRTILISLMPLITRSRNTIKNSTTHPTYTLSHSISTQRTIRQPEYIPMDNTHQKPSRLPYVAAGAAGGAVIGGAAVAGMQGRDSDDGDDDYAGNNVDGNPGDRYSGDTNYGDGGNGHAYGGNGNNNSGDTNGDENGGQDGCCSDCDCDCDCNCCCGNDPNNPNGSCCVVM